MSGSHRNEIPGDVPGTGGYDPAPPDDSSPGISPARPSQGGSSEWFPPREPRALPAPGSGGYASGTSGVSGSGDLGERERDPSADYDPYGSGSSSTGSGSSGYGDGSGDRRRGGSDGPRRGGSGYVRSESVGYGSSGSDRYGRGGRGRYDSGGYSSRPERGRRSLSALIGPLAGAVGLAVILGAAVYTFADSAGCGSDNTITLNVSTAGDITPAVTATASQFNDQKREVNGRCVQAVVKTADPAAVTTLLSGQGVSGQTTERPDVWIPDSSLWTSLVLTSAKGKDSIQVTKTSVARTPLVVGIPKTLASDLGGPDAVANPSWTNLLSAEGGASGGTVTKNDAIPANLIRLRMLDPARNAGGMAALMLTRTVLANDPNADVVFTGVVRAARDRTAPDIATMFGSLDKDKQGRYPVLLAPEQAVWKHNQGRPTESITAAYPVEGTISLDYPVAVTTGDADKIAAAKLLEQALSTPSAQEEARTLGFRSGDGVANDSFEATTGVNRQRPRFLPDPRPTDVKTTMQAWSKLLLGTRMLTLVDVSGSMAETVPGANVTRMRATAEVARGGISMLPDDTEAGLWSFSTQLAGDRDWREHVPVGPLSQQVGSKTRRELVYSELSALTPKATGDTGLYDTVLAAFRTMKGSYKPEFVNSVVLFTDGRNDDQQGISLKELLTTLEKEYDPNRPVQVIMIGFGDGVDQNELTQIAKATRGSVQIAHTQEEIQKIVLKAISRRICTSDC